MHAAKNQTAAGGLVNLLNTKANLPRPFAPHRSFKRRHFPAQGFNPSSLGGLQHTRKSIMFLFCSIIDSNLPLVNHPLNDQKYLNQSAN